MVFVRPRSFFMVSNASMMPLVLLPSKDNGNLYSPSDEFVRLITIVYKLLLKKSEIFSSLLYFF